VPYDATWPATYGVVRGRIVDALGDAALAIEHIGSTSVSGLAAKPWVDVDLTVADSADEPSYLPAIEAAGFALVLRQPEWQEHRVLRLPDPAAVLHV
jgi:GrpB-like predicted nucleotidyltransferase (UPF0157 family)